MKTLQIPDHLVTGHAEVDTEHEQLLVLRNELVELLEAGDGDGCASTLNQFTMALDRHIENEERIMVDLGCWNLVEHKNQHIYCKKKLAVLKLDAGRNGYGSNTIDELTSIIFDDVINADMEFKSYLQKIDYRE